MINGLFKDLVIKSSFGSDSTIINGGDDLVFFNMVNEVSGFSVETTNESAIEFFYTSNIAPNGIAKIVDIQTSSDIIIVNGGGL